MKFTDPRLVSMGIGESDSLKVKTLDPSNFVSAETGVALDPEGQKRLDGNEMSLSLPR